MPATGPGEAPPVVRRRARRVRRQEAKKTTQRQTQQARVQQRQYPSQARSVEKTARRQRAQRPRHVAEVVPGVGPTVRRPRPVRAPRRAPRVVAVIPGVGQAREQQRAIRGVPKREQPRVLRRVQQRQRETNLPDPSRHGLRYDPGTRYGPPDKKGVRKIFDASGKQIGIRAPYRANAGNAASLPGPVALIRGAGKAATKALDASGAPRLVRNIPKDAAELAVTTPTSLAKLAVTAATDPKKVPGMVAAPYKELAKNPKEFITEHPVSTVLMVEPGRRAPGLAAGKVARVTGKQTLARPAATLPGTALKEARTGSRSAGKRAVQARKDRKNPEPVMTEKQVKRRVDEFYDQGKQHVRRVESAAARQAKERKLTKDQALEHIEGARGGAKSQVDKRFAEEFGSTYTRTPQGVVLKPKQAVKGALHDSRADAEKIAERAPFEAQVIEAGDKFAVVPRIAAETRRKHGSVGSSAAPGSKVMRVAGKSFRTAVLPLSAKWLAGQGTEAGIRSAVAGAGPTSLVREARIFRAMERDKPGSGHEFRARTSSGGQFGLTGTAREFATGGRTLAEEFEGTSLEPGARAMTKAAAAPGIKHVRQGFNRYSSFVFDTVNGALEQTARRAMTGKAIKQSPLMERHVLGLTDKAIADAARGLKATENQVAAGRAVDRMYGQYQKFSWEKRETLLHSTPFYPWYRNMVTFLTKTLPVDHPVKTALIADLDAATEEWRKAHGLSLRGGKQRPGFLMGGYPTGKGGEQTIRVARYLPFAPKDVSGATADLFFPQFSGTLMNLKGLEWTGKELKGSPITNAALTTAEAHIPGVSQVGRITGLADRYVRGKNVPSVLQGKDLKEAVIREVNPIAPTKKREKDKKKKLVRRKPVGGYPGFDGSSSGSSGGYPGF